MGYNMTWDGQTQSDLRVLLKVPKDYLVMRGGGYVPEGESSGALEKVGGILFPYTPSISYNNQATYVQQAPTHSLYSSYFFKNSNVGPISITGKFTCQNEYEASVILATQTLLRTLTKMRWGNDTNAGSPPPVCRLFAFGNSMLNNVPVAVASWKIDYPDSVDYIEVGGPNSVIDVYGHNFVPVQCSLTMELTPMYSRDEQLKYNNDDFLYGVLDNKGYI